VLDDLDEDRQRLLRRVGPLQEGRQLLHLLVRVRRPVLQSKG
jgi:hypothetical protein